MSNRILHAKKRALKAKPIKKRKEKKNEKQTKKIIIDREIDRDRYRG